MVLEVSTLIGHQETLSSGKCLYSVGTIWLM